MQEDRPNRNQPEGTDRLREIRDQEETLTRERMSILRSAPWYRRPGSVISVLAIFVSIALFVLNIFITQQKKELAISYSKPSTLVFFTSSLKPKSKIMFEGKPVEDVWRSVLYIKNVGTRAIQEGDFKDGPLTFKIPISPHLESRNNDSTSLPFLLDVVPKASAGQRQATTIIKERRLPAVFEYSPTIINPDDVVELEVYTSIPIDYEILVEGKIFEGVVLPISKLNELPTSAPKLSSREMIVGGLNQLFGAKWVTLAFFAIGLIATGFLSFGTWVLADENDWELPTIVIFTTALLVDAVVIVVLVFTVLT